MRRPVDELKAQATTDPQGCGHWLPSPIPGAPDRFVEDIDAITEAEARSYFLTVRQHAAIAPELVLELEEQAASIDEHIERLEEPGAVTHIAAQDGCDQTQADRRRRDEVAWLSWQADRARATAQAYRDAAPEEIASRSASAGVL